jgi:uncharacterized protein (DUF362 family)
MTQKALPVIASSPSVPGGPQRQSRQLTRREVITRVAATSAVGLASVGLGTWLLKRPPAGPRNLPQLRDHRVARTPGGVDMVIAHGDQTAELVHQAIAAIGGMGTFIQRGEAVAIKPNAAWNRQPAQAANTNPEVVAQVVREVLAAGARVVWVCDNSMNQAELCFDRSGIGPAARQAGAKVILPSSGGFRTVHGGGQIVQQAEVLWPFVEADKIINIPVVKHHNLCSATMAMKNWYGVLGGNRARLHQDIHQSIVDLAAMMKPTLTILDATRVLLANGPTGGSLDDVKTFNTIAISCDEVALDAFGLHFLGRSANEVPYVGKAEQAGLGHVDYHQLRVEEIGT